jgi:hypothetical protein
MLASIGELEVVMTRTLVLLAATLLVAGCMHTTGGVAPSNVPLAQGGYTVIGPAYGDDCQWALLGLLPLSGGNETRRAVEQAIAETPGTDALVNVSADTFTQFWIILTRHCTEVHATAVKIAP